MASCRRTLIAVLLSVSSLVNLGFPGIRAAKLDQVGRLFRTGVRFAFLGGQVERIA